MKEEWSVRLWNKRRAVLTGVKCEKIDWNRRAQDMVQWIAIANTAEIPQIPQKQEFIYQRSKYPFTKEGPAVKN
jgi:hypothetical protein